MYDKKIQFLTEEITREAMIIADHGDGSYSLEILVDGEAIYIEEAIIDVDFSFVS